MQRDEKDRSPIDIARELFVFAPIGLATRLSKELPDLVAEGKSRYTVVKTVSEFAAKQGRSQFEDRLRSAAEAFCNPAPRSTTTSAKPGATTTTTTTTTAPPTAGASSRSKASTAARSNLVSDSASLAIPRYDTLSATQVLAHLPSLSLEERAAVAAYERSTRNRRTILSRIDLLNTSGT